MICRRLLMPVLGASLVMAGALFTIGCGGSDPGQPGRETISAPRKGGGMEEPGPAGKDKGKAGGKLGGKGGAPS
jgi:hypothetical protein